MLLLVSMVIEVCCVFFFVVWKFVWFMILLVVFLFMKGLLNRFSLNFLCRMC